jgi:hypothetical protein
MFRYSNNTTQNWYTTAKLPCINQAAVSGRFAIMRAMPSLAQSFLHALTLFESAY